MAETKETKMTVLDLIRALNPKRVIGERDGTVCGLVYDSRQVVPGSAFFALRGVGTDGHDYIDSAISRGATLIVMEEEREIPVGAAGLIVDDARRALAAAAALWFGNPTEKMKVIGVTGTNGKTTITYLLEAMMLAAGWKPAVIGTVSYRFGRQEVAASHTTPESYELQRTLAEFVQGGADALVIEVSSHALEQKRVHGVRFDVGIFTNLTPEHLDYHGTMGDYYLSKKRLFSEYIVPGNGVAVVNVDDCFGRRLNDEFSGCVTCGISPEANVRSTDLQLSRSGIAATVALQHGEFSFQSSLLGQFNVNNLLCAIAAAEAAGIPSAAIRKGIEAVTNVPGRLERVENRLGVLILVDYAHTGDALENVLATVKGLQPKRILTIFGCGGDRDRTKRPIMGEVAARFSDIAIVTSDNPRTEQADLIIQEIIPGIRKHFASELAPGEIGNESARGFIAIEDRREAIQLAVGALRKGDLLLVAGKGHEDYQIIGTEKIHFDDTEEIQKVLREMDKS